MGPFKGLYCSRGWLLRVLLVEFGVCGLRDRYGPPRWHKRNRALKTRKVLFTFESTENIFPGFGLGRRLDGDSVE